MEKPPQFIKKFSKEESSEERQQAAQEIKAKRGEYFIEKSAQMERQIELQQSASESERASAEQLKSINNLENEIAELSTSTLGKILNYFQLRKLRADILVGQKTYEELKQKQDIEIAEERTISEKLESEETPPALQEAKSMLDKFYKKQGKKWAKSEYTKEDITKYFSEEHLASLSIEDYALLLKRFPREMVAHVTRQGIRDHTGHSYHTAGVGAYDDSFMKMAEDGRLRSPLGVYLVEEAKNEAIEKYLLKYLQLDSLESKEEAIKSLDIMTDIEQQQEGGSYADRMAIHFAAEEVADVYYGSEKGNEIFIAYPAAYIASQYYFNSGEGLTGGGGGYWNDQWIWANEERGMDLNAGLVFIPEEAKVDRKTGSRYELDKSNNPIENTEYQSVLKKLIDSPDFNNFANQVMKLTVERRYPWGHRSEELRQQFCQRLEQEFGMADRRLQFAALDYNNLEKFIRQRKGYKADPFYLDITIREALKKNGIFYSESKNTISSKEFWEAYFAKNPEKRPSKIVYYKGENPTSALQYWREERGIQKRAEDGDLGFSERRVKRGAPQAMAGLGRFRALAEKVIEDHFAQKELVSR